MQISSPQVAEQAQLEEVETSEEEELLETGLKTGKMATRSPSVRRLQA